MSQVQGNPAKVAVAIREMLGDHTAVVVPGNGRWLLDFTVVLDPLSKAAQQLSAVLEFLRGTLQPSIKASSHGRHTRCDIHDPSACCNSAHPDSGSGTVEGSSPILPLCPRVIMHQCGRPHLQGA